MKLGKCIKVARAMGELRQGVAAKQIGITQAYLSQIESEKRSLSIKTLSEITKVLDMTITISKGEVKAELENNND